MFRHNIHVPAEKKDVPVIDREQGAELARQLAQQQVLTEALGGLWPDLSSQELEHVEQILDLGCGPGSWALQVAYQHQDREIVGVDLSEAMISYAIAQANVRSLENISFEVMDIRQPLAFGEQSFDLVNGCLLSGMMTPSTWPKLLAECMRVLRPGGILRLTEVETWITNSAAGMRLWRAFCRALQTQGRSFSVDGSSLGIAPMLGKLLRDAGLAQVRQRAFTLDASACEPLHVSGSKAIEMTFELLRPYLLRSGLLTEELFETHLRHLVMEMYGSDWTSLAFGLTVCARKPQPDVEPTGRTIEVAQLVGVP